MKMISYRYKRLLRLWVRNPVQRYHWESQLFLSPTLSQLSLTIKWLIKMIGSLLSRRSLSRHLLRRYLSKSWSCKLLLQPLTSVTQLNNKSSLALSVTRGPSTKHRHWEAIWANPIPTWAQSSLKSRRRARLVLNRESFWQWLRIDTDKGILTSLRTEACLMPLK